MSSLLEIQEKFLKALLENNKAFLEDAVEQGGIPSDARLQVYFNTIQLNLLNALRLTFPLTWKLIGEKCAEVASLYFYKKFMPQSGSLDTWGATFPDFFKNFEATKSVPYLPDVSTFEWLRHLAHIALNVSPLDFNEIKEKTAYRDLDDLRLTLHPSVRFFKSSFPLHKIIPFLEEDADSPLSLKEGPSFALIARPFGKAETWWLDEALYETLKLISESMPLKDVMETVEALYPNFKFERALETLFKNSLLWKII